MRLCFLGVCLVVMLFINSGCQNAAFEDDRFARVMAEGERVYLLNCQRCHHPDGQGYRHLFPQLSRSPIVNYHDPTPMIQLVVNGRGSMPSFGDTLSQEEIAAVLTYIRNSWVNNAPPIRAEQIPE